MINTNYALEAGLKLQADTIAIEAKENNPYGNIIAVREQDKPVFKTLVHAYNSPEVAAFLRTRYQGALLPVWSGKGSGEQEGEWADIRRAAPRRSGAALGHRVIGGDGHTVEFLPAFRDYLGIVGRLKLVRRFDRWVRSEGTAAWSNLPPASAPTGAPDAR